MPPNSFLGARIFIVEDNRWWLCLSRIYSRIWAATSWVSRTQLEEAVIKASSMAFDGLILDLNLNGSETFDVAEVLTKRGTPFVFATGYGASGVPEAYHGVPILTKPFQRTELELCLACILTNGKACPVAAAP